MAGKYKALLALATTVIIYAVLHVIAKSQVGIYPSMYVTFLRITFALLAFMPFIFIKKSWKKKNFSKLLVTSLFAAVNVIFFMYGIEYTSASVSQLVYALMPILTVVISFILFKKKISFYKIIGVLVGFIGISYIYYLSFTEKGETITGSLTGNLLISVAMICWLTYIFRSKNISTYFSPVEIGSVTSVTAFALTLPFAVTQLYLRKYSPVLSLNLLSGTFYMGFFGTFLAWILIQYAVSKLSPLTVNLTTYVQPIATTILAVIFLHEKLTVNFITGSLLIFIGIFLTATWELYNYRKS